MKATVVLVCVLAGTAFADDRKHAEQLERDAHASHDLEKYVAAGQAYLDLYNADPTDENLYNAAVLFESGAAMGSAVAAYTTLMGRYPTSRITPRAIARLGKLYGDLAMFDKAADRLEEYAKKYAGEADAYAAMSDAVFYRRALGDRARAIADTQYFTRTWGAKKPREAADAMWSLSSLYTDDDLIKHLREYLRTYGAKGGHDRVVIAHAKIGLELWKQTCKLVDGLCVKATLKTRTCGKGTAQTLTALPRDARKMKEALAAFASATKEFESQRDDSPEARYYYAQSKLALADVELERYFALALPRNLDVTHDAGKKRFEAWLDEKQKLGATANRRYDEVFTIKDAATSITAAERTALITQSLASTLVTSSTACETTLPVAEPLEERALTGFGVCLAKSTELGWFNEASTVCERELIRLAPETFPPLREHRPDALNVAPVIAGEPPLR